MKKGNVTAVLYKPLELGKLKEAIQVALSKQKT